MYIGIARFHLKGPSNTGLQEWLERVENHCAYYPVPVLQTPIASSTWP